MAYLRDRNDSLLDIWEDLYGFDSYRYNRSNDTLPQIVDLYFGSVINEDKMVRIGDSIFRIDVLNQRVYVLKNITEANVGYLRTWSIIPGTIDTFSTDYELLWPDVGNPEDGPILKEMGCGKADKNEESEARRYKNSIYIANTLIEYKRYGIYFTVVNMVEHRKNGQGKRSSRTTLKIESYNWYWKVKGTCNSFYQQNGSSQQSNAFDLRRAPYGSSKSLAEYILISAGVFMLQTGIMSIPQAWSLHCCNWATVTMVSSGRRSSASALTWVMPGMYPKMAVLVHLFICSM